ncbi:iron chaperone [Aeromicrobium sp.]|uniref:iron chaperone n=1 Tax=Aeromicrobium sp. TaxID=1871063 RepID=UPI002FCB4BF1
MAERFDTVDEYIASFPAEVQAILEDVRATIKAAVPGSGETIRYQMPCVMLGDRYLVHYAGWSKHIGLYPVPVAGADLEPAIAPLRSDKDTVKLMYDRPVPHDLLRRIAQFIAAQHA